MTELFYSSGKINRAAIYSDHNSQRMAALPCVLAVQALASGEAKRMGAITAYELIDAAQLLEQIAAAGYQLTLFDKIN